MLLGAGPAIVAPFAISPRPTRIGRSEIPGPRPGKGIVLKTTAAFPAGLPALSGIFGTPTAGGFRPGAGAPG